MSFLKKTAISVSVLLAWKVVRTDWVVTAPDCYNDTDPPASLVYGTATYYPPISPVWSPPTPAGLNPSTKNWEDFFPGSGTYELTGPARLSPNVGLIAIKFFGGAIILMGILRVFFGGSRRCLNCPTIKTPD